MSEYNIGAKIRKLRHDRRLTLQKVSTDIGVSTALISQIENGHISPPIATLTRIAKYFDVKMVDFFAETEEPCRFEVVRAATHRMRPGVSADAGEKLAVEIFAKSRFAKKLAPMIVDIPGACRDDKGHSHGGEEFNYVMAGKVSIRYGNQSIVLESGDCIYFDAETNHSLVSADGSPVKLLSILSRQG